MNIDVTVYNTPEFSAALVIEKVFEFRGCDPARYEWLTAVGLDRSAVDAIRNPVRRYQRGDIVRTKLGTYASFTGGRLYFVDNGERNFNVQLLADDGQSQYLHTDHIKLVQASLLETVGQTVAHETPDFTKEKVIRETFNKAHGEADRTRAQRVEWLASVGIPEAEVDEVIPDVRLHKRGDIVRCIGRRIDGESYSDIKFGKLYAVLYDSEAVDFITIHNEIGQDYTYRDSSNFELFQAVDA